MQTSDMFRSDMYTNFMLKRSGLLSLGMLWAVAAWAAEEPADSVMSETLQEVVVINNSARHRIGSMRLGAEQLELSKLTRLPSFGGEADVIKSITLLPGVRSEGEGGGGFEVRGGNAYQNLVMLDGISLYNPSHVMGIFSTFNDAALGGATLYKGSDAGHVWRGHIFGTRHVSCCRRYGGISRLSLDRHTCRKDKRPRDRL